MNKGRRQELVKLKFKKRLVTMHVTPEDLERYDYRHFKHSSTPCSCYMCRGLKYRNVDRQKNKIIEEY